MELKGRTVLVTGASQGIGAALAVALGREGAVVLLASRSASALEAVAADVEAAGGRATAFPVDLSDPGAVSAMADAVRETHGVPDVIVNNAGAGRWLAVEETDPVEAVQMMAVPYFAAFSVTRAFLPELIARGSGWVLCVNSPACIIPIAGATAYSASRAALRTFTRGLAREVRGTGLGVTHLIAGKVSSTYFENNPGSEERVPGASRLIPTLTPEQVADAVVRCLRRERSGEVTVPFVARMLVWTSRFAPWLVEQLVWQTGWKRPR